MRTFEDDPVIEKIYSAYYAGRPLSPLAQRSMREIIKKRQESTREYIVDIGETYDDEELKKRWHVTSNGLGRFVMIEGRLWSITQRRWRDSDLRKQREQN